MAVEKLRRYELIYLVHPDAEEDQLERMEQRIDQVVADFETLVIKREDWGKRKLAYEIEKINKAYYRYMEFVVRPAMIAELERVLRLIDVVIRYQTIRLEDKIPADALDRFAVEAETETKAPVVAEATPSTDDIQAEEETVDNE